MGIVIEQRPSDFSGGALQSLGNIATSALDAAVAGVAASTKAIIDDGDKGIIDDGLKVFRGFDQNTFEFAKTDEKSLKGQIQNAAEYVSPAQFLSNAKDASYNDVLKKMQDPQFKVSDGLASFAGKEITKTISGQIQKPGNDVLEKGIIVVDGKPDGINNIPITQDNFIKLRKLDLAVKHQLGLHQTMTTTPYKGY
jgi:hypothetical protein